MNMVNMDSFGQQRRTVLKRILFAGCALTAPALVGCDRKEDRAIPEIQQDEQTPQSEQTPQPEQRGEQTSQSAQERPAAGNAGGANKISKEQAQYQEQPKGDQRQ